MLISKRYVNGDDVDIYDNGDDDTSADAADSAKADNATNVADCDANDAAAGAGIATGAAD